MIGLDFSHYEYIHMASMGPGMAPIGSDQGWESGFPIANPPGEQGCGLAEDRRVWLRGQS